MKIAGGVEEEGLVVGNTFDKYNSRNPIVKQIMRGFDAAIDDAVTRAKPKSIIEVGCGEGFWTLKWALQGIEATGLDVSAHTVSLARANANEAGLPASLFSVKSIYELSDEDEGRDLVVCCEVLEHLRHPDEGLKALKSIASEWVLLSVPREPLWRVLNLARGKYVRELGNTPGHLQHWSKRKFLDFVSSEFTIEHVYSPVPWTMVLCRRS